MLHPYQNESDQLRDSAEEESQESFGYHMSLNVERELLIEVSCLPHPFPEAYALLI